MIDLALQLLRLDDFKGVSDNIDIAKGKYQLQTNLFKAWKNYKRYKK